jgi:hypothetical protein
MIFKSTVIGFTPAPAKYCCGLQCAIISSAMKCQCDQQAVVVPKSTSSPQGIRSSWTRLPRRMIGFDWSPSRSDRRISEITVETTAHNRLLHPPVKSRRLKSIFFEVYSHDRRARACSQHKIPSLQTLRHGRVNSTWPLFARPLCLQHKIPSLRGHDGNVIGRPIMLKP